MIAAAIAQTPHEFDCKTCQIRACDVDRRLPGSKGPAPYEAFHIRNLDPNGPPLWASNICPLPSIDATIWQVFRLYRFYEKGVLLNAGGVYDQPNQYLDAMQVIEQAFKNV